MESLLLAKYKIWSNKTKIKSNSSVQGVYKIVEVLRNVYQTVFYKCRNREACKTPWAFTEGWSPLPGAWIRADFMEEATSFVNLKLSILS